jgi:hypothetical protein
MNHAAHSKVFSRFGNIPWAMVALALGTILINAGFLALCWRMMHHAQVQQQESARRTHELHGKLREELEEVISLVPATATQDLCQVRFRFRYADGVSTPILPHQVELHRSSGDGEWTDMNIRRTCQSILNLGYLPPGEYRLSLTNSMGMECHHEFRILPGVPVDRVAYCPRPAPWSFLIPPFAFKVQSVWPTEWNSQPIVAVYHLKAKGPEIQGWKWQAPASQRFHRCVVAGPLRGPLREQAFCAALPKALSQPDVPPELQLDSPQGILLDYGACELAAISFVLDRTDKKQGYIHLGTCRFRGESPPPDPTTSMPGEAEILLSQAAPVWDIASQPADGFALEIPRAMVRLVAERAKALLEGDATAISKRPFGLQPPLPLPTRI